MDVLRRNRGAGNQEVGPWKRDEYVEDKANSTGEQRVERAYKVFWSAAEDRVIPQLNAEPSTAGGPEPPLCPIDRCSGAPNVGVMMHHPAAGAIVGRRNLSSSHAHVLNELDERLHALA